MCIYSLGDIVMHFLEGLIPSLLQNKQGNSTETSELSSNLLVYKWESWKSSSKINLKGA